MGTVTRLSPAGVSLRSAIDAYLATLSGAEQAKTLRAYSRPLNAAAAEFGDEADLDSTDADRFAGWFTGKWSERRPATWNASLAAFRSAATYWQAQGWITADPSRRLVRRKPDEDRSRAMSRAEVDGLLTRKDIALRERTLWRMLYETAARSAEVLALNIEDLDQANHCAKVRRKGGAVDVIVWQTGTARLLPRLIQGRKSGPLFVTERKARVQLPAADLDEHGRARLSYQQAENLFKAASGGRTLHQWRHSALTHDAEDGTGAPMLKARSGHRSIRSLAPYARVSAEALQRHQARRDPGRRR